jgi:hypothetical protein
VKDVMGWEFYLDNINFKIHNYLFVWMPAHSWVDQFSICYYVKGKKYPFKNLRFFFLIWALIDLPYENTSINTCTA